MIQIKEKNAFESLIDLFSPGFVGTRPGLLFSCVDHLCETRSLDSSAGCFCWRGVQLVLEWRANPRTGSKEDEICLKRQTNSGRTIVFNCPTSSRKDSQRIGRTIVFNCPMLQSLDSTSHWILQSKMNLLKHKWSVTCYHYCFSFKCLHLIVRYSLSALIWRLLRLSRVECIAHLIVMSVP